MATGQPPTQQGSDLSEISVPTPRQFPDPVPERRLDSKEEQLPELTDAIRKQWDGIVVDETMHLEIPPDQVRDLVYHGATELVKELRLLSDPLTFRTCVRWLLVYQRTWLSAKNDTDLKILAVLWNELLHHGPQIGEQRHWFLDHATNSYQQFYEAQRTEHNFKVARSLAGTMLRNASTPRQYIQAQKRTGQLYGSHLNKFEPSERHWRLVLNTCIYHQEFAIAKLRETPDIEPLDTDKQIYEQCAWALEKRYDVAYQDADIIKLIEYHGILAEREKDNTQARLVWYDKLARSHWKRFTTLTNIQDGKNGVAIFEKILEVEPDNPHALTGLAQLLKLISGVEILSNTERRAISSRCVELLERCIATTPDNHPNLPNRLGKLSDALVERYNFDADIEDIDMAIALQITAIDLFDKPSDALAYHHQQLAEKYMLKFHNTKDREEIDAAIVHIRKCIDMSSSLDGQVRGTAQLGLANIYGVWYEYKKQLKHLNLAISIGEEALALCASSGWRSLNALQHLAKYYGWRFNQLHDPDDAAKGIKYIREGINMARTIAGQNKLSHEIECLSTLSRLMRLRARSYQAEEDFDEAVKAARDALKLTDIEHQAYTTRAVGMSEALTERFSVFGNPKDLTEADTILDVAMQNLRTRRIPATNAELAFLEAQQGTICTGHWYTTSDSKWARKALTHFHEAVNAQPLELEYLFTYATTLSKLATDSDNLQDALNALRLCQEYTQKISDTAPDTAEVRLPALLENIARLCLRKVQNVAISKIFLPFANKMLEEICKAKLATVNSRLWAAAQRSELAAEHERNFETASRFINLAASLLPELLNPGLSRIDQLRLSKDHSNLPSFTLAFHIMTGHNIFPALQLFEQTRGVLWNRLLREHDELDILDGVEPDLAKRFRELHSQLSAPRKPLVTFESDRSMAFDIPDSYANATQYNDLLKQIRLQPGLHDFLQLPTQLDELSSYAQDGAIVVVNCVAHLAHAILVTSSEVSILALPEYSNDTAKQLYEKMKSAIELLRNQDETSASKLYNEVCTSLWTSIAKPVLDKLDELLPEDSIRQWKSKPVHRIWWLANQYINVLPIHAAGDYTQSNGETVLDRSISSYIPNFGALKFAHKNNLTRQSSGSTTTDNHYALIVSMPTTLGHVSLPQALEEASTISTTLQQQNTTIQHLSAQHATRTSILSALKSCRIAHFICHGQTDAADPLKSALLLSDHQRSPLDVKALLRAKIPACNLVYLSVCSGAASDTLPLIDEGLHVAGAFLMAGVPAVVATRWELEDRVAGCVAEVFYQGFEGGVDAARSAGVLRDVLIKAKEEGVAPLLYGSYVQYGM